MRRMLGVALAAVVGATGAEARDLAVVGGTLVDVGDAGRSTRDIADAVVLIHDGKIARVGPRGRVRIPKGAEVVDAAGGYVTPGLIDGDGALRSQAYADAYLEEGVTSVYVQLAAGRGEGEDAIAQVRDGPRVLQGRTISGYVAEPEKDKAWVRRRPEEPRLGDQALAAAVDAAADKGARAVILSFDLWPDQLGAVVGEARRRGLGTIAVPARSSYRQMAEAGVEVIAHNDRHGTVVAPPGLQAALADDPMGKAAGPAFRAICAADLGAPSVKAYAAELQARGVFVIPLLSIEDTADDLDGLNPWRLRSAAFFRPADLDDPVDPATGARPYLESHPDRRDQLKACALRRQAFDRFLHASGVGYLAGSGAPSYGVMPGSGVHEEMRLLVHIGLTPREALAAATANFARAYGWPDVGRIEAGRAGDVLVLDADPRRDVAALDRLRAVIHDGKLVDRDALRAKAGAGNG